MATQLLKVGRQPGQTTITVRVGSVVFGNSHVPVIAGPCSVESRDMLESIVNSVKASGATMFRGGAFKPRTSPYDFQGHGKKALRWMAEVSAKTDLPFVTEVLDTADVDVVAQYSPMLQIGSRNMHNSALLIKAGQSGKPILLKRGLSATLNEWRHAAEYILNEGNNQVVLCERGIRSFDNETRNVADLAAIAIMRQTTRLPVIFDPSHALGRTDIIADLAAAAAACGADGLLLEVHHQPEEALSDGQQSLTLKQFAHVMHLVRPFANLRSRHV